MKFDHIFIIYNYFFFRILKDNDNWYELKKQLREFTTNTQEELEQERAGLLSQNAMLQQEVQELQGYIDSHLTRWVKLFGFSPEQVAVKILTWAGDYIDAQLTRWLYRFSP